MRAEAIQAGTDLHTGMNDSGTHTARSWGSDLGQSDGIPPISPPPEPPIFPWSSIEELEEQLDSEAGEMAAVENLHEAALVAPG